MMDSFNLENLIRPNILKLVAYSSARLSHNTGILLDANENPFPPTSTNIESEVKNELNRYPDPLQYPLKRTILQIKAAQLNLDVDNLFLGQGSDEVIDLLIRIFCSPGKDKVMVMDPSYGMYKVSANINDIEVIKVLLTEQFQLNVEEIVNTLKTESNIKVIFLCQPGNPTGQILKLEDITFILENFNGIVLVDEAYIDFANCASTLNLLDKYKNLVVCQTFSKAYGLAGIRLGMAFASKEIIHLFNKTKPPYNLSKLTVDYATTQLQPDNLLKIQQNIRTLINSRKSLLEEIVKFDKVKILGGLDTNFLLIQIFNDKDEIDDQKAKFIYSELIDKFQIVVRYRGGENLCKGSLRITVGSEQENYNFLNAFDTILKEYK